MATASGRRRAATAAVLEPVEASPPARDPAPVEAAAEFRLAAQAYAREALEALAWLVRNAASEAVRVSAANALIDRAHGRPAQAVRVGGGEGAPADDSHSVSLTFQWLDPGKC